MSRTVCLILFEPLNSYDLTPQKATEAQKPPRLGQYHLCHTSFKDTAPLTLGSEMGIMAFSFLCFDNLIISISRLKHSWSLLDVIWHSLGYTLQFQASGAPDLCLYPTGHLCLASWTSPLFTQHLPKWVVAACLDSRNTGA